MTLDDFTLLDVHALALPARPIPRPGEEVTWYSGARRVTGTYRGHDAQGRPLIINEFGNPFVPQSHNSIRLSNPLRRKGPNWTELRDARCIRRPPEQIVNEFKTLLAKRIPPGPSYFDLAYEIWARGFEVYVVGGTVRDVLSGREANDVDLVTTMPLFVAMQFLKSMYRYEPSSSENRGFIRLGGAPASGDPFIDLKVFSDSMIGSSDATFGVGFDRDVAHRDFSINALYYDPINEVLIDPTSRGIEDVLSGKLRLICNVADPFQHAQIFVRFFKFRNRGFESTEETIVRIREEYSQAVPVMKFADRKSYVSAQVLSKCSSEDDHQPALEAMRDSMCDCGVEHVWTTHFQPIFDEMFA